MWRISSQAAVVVVLDGLEPLADLLDVAQAGLLHLPLPAQVLELLLDLRDLRLDLGSRSRACSSSSCLEHPLGELELEQPALEDVDLGRDRLELHRQPAGRLVDQVDGLVGEEAVGDVAGRQLGRRDQGRVLDLDLVVDLVPLLDAAEDGDRVVDRGLADEDRLEPPLEGGVLLDVLAELVERGGADAAELAAGQGRLEQVGRVHRPLGLARADDQVQLVDEEDDPPLGLGDVLEDRLEPLLELAAELGARRPARPCRARSACGSAGVSGTSPETIRWARPSTIAVLPTPGSPIRTGLFLVRRQSTWTTRRISESRPMTGSILPLRASSTRSRPYRSSAWYLSSGFWSVTGLAAADLLERPEDLLLVDAQGVEQLLGPALDLRPGPSRRCSTETYWSFIRSASAWAVSSTAASSGPRSARRR